MIVTLPLLINLLAAVPAQVQLSVLTLETVICVYLEPVNTGVQMVIVICQRLQHFQLVVVNALRRLNVKLQVIVHYACQVLVSIDVQITFWDAMFRMLYALKRAPHMLIASTLETAIFACQVNVNTDALMENVTSRTPHRCVDVRATRKPHAKMQVIATHVLMASANTQQTQIQFNETKV